MAGDDDASGNPGSTIPIKVLDNDSDPDDDTLTIVGYDSASVLGGIVSCDTKKCTYNGPDGWSERDSFTYTVSDGKGGTATAIVTLTPVG